jgi:hypothetical protein
VKTQDLTAHAVYAHRIGLNANINPVWLLDTKAWMMGERTGKNGIKQFSIEVAPRQNMRADQNPYSGPLTTGIPAVVLEASTYRWLAENDAERFADSAFDLLKDAAEEMAGLLGDYPDENTPVRRRRVEVTLADGRKATVRATLIFIRPQNLMGAWTPVLNKERLDRDATFQTIAEREAEKASSELVDRQIADRVDAVLADGKERSPYNGLRPDVQRYRGAGELQVSLETFLRLLALAESGARRAQDA